MNKNIKYLQEPNIRHVLSLAGFTDIEITLDSEGVYKIIALHAVTDILGFGKGTCIPMAMEDFFDSIMYKSDGPIDYI